MWIRVDECTDVLVSLVQCFKSVSDVDREPPAWKWAVLSLHSALQGAMVCHLSGTAQLGALTERSVTGWLKWHTRDEKGEIKRVDTGKGELGIPQFTFAAKQDRPPVEWLADAMELFKRLSDQERRLESGAGALLTISAGERAAFTRLHSLRNDFTHFAPRGWSIELAGLPDTFLDVLTVLQKIYADPWPFRHMDARQRTQLRALMGNVRAALGMLSSKYEGSYPQD
jgi:hypothetical protein